MLVEFQGVAGQAIAVDAADVAMVLPAEDQANKETPLIGVSSLVIRGAQRGVGVRGSVSEIVAAINAARR